MRILVTGASGFIGRHAVSSLLRLGHEVIAAGRWPDYSICPDWISCDLLEEGESRRCASEAKADALLHLAWSTEHGKNWTDPLNARWTLVTLELIEGFLESGGRRVCIAGTCFEYDWPNDSDCDEQLTPPGRHTLYDIEKSACRLALERFANYEQISFAWGRVFYLYGEYEFPARLVSSVCRSLVRNQPALCSSGKAIRDFMDARDAGAALAALTLSNIRGTVNIASGEAIEVRQVAELLGAIYGRPDLVKIGALPDRPNDPPRISASTARLRDEVGFRPAISIELGLRDALDFWRKH